MSRHRPDEFLPRILERFRAVRPEFDLSIICATSDDLIEQTWRGEIDIGLVTNRSPAEVEAVGEEPLLWVASADHATERHDPLPIAVSKPGCAWRRFALEGLEAIGRRATIVLVSTSADAIAAAVLSGVAVATVRQGALRPGMRVIGLKDGFPSLPTNQIGIVRPWTRTAAPGAHALARVIRKVVAGGDRSVVFWIAKSGWLYAPRSACSLGTLHARLTCPWCKSYRVQVDPRAPWCARS